MRCLTNTGVCFRLCGLDYADEMKIVYDIISLCVKVFHSRWILLFCFRQKVKHFISIYQIFLLFSIFLLFLCCSHDFHQRFAAIRGLGLKYAFNFRFITELSNTNLTFSWLPKTKSRVTAVVKITIDEVNLYQLLSHCTSICSPSISINKRR